MRKLKLLLHFLFNWQIKPSIIRYGEWKSLRSPMTPQRFRPPLLGYQRWIWNHPYHYCACYKRMQLVRTVVDGRLQKTHPAELAALEKEIVQKNLEREIKKRAPKKKKKKSTKKKR